MHRTHEWQADYCAIEERRQFRREQVSIALKSASITALSIISLQLLDEDLSSEAKGYAGQDSAVYTPIDHPSPELKEFETAMDRAAERILGFEVDVICADIEQKTDESGQTDFFIMGVHFPPAPDEINKIVIDAFYCESMRYLSAGVGGHSYDSLTEIDFYGGRGIYVFGHEIAHASGISDEGKANCRAVNLYKRVADELGIDSYISDIDSLDFVRAIPQPIEYHSAGC